MDIHIQSLMSTIYQYHRSLSVLGRPPQNRRTVLVALAELHPWNDDYTMCQMQMRIKQGGSNNRQISKAEVYFL